MLCIFQNYFTWIHLNIFILCKSQLNQWICSNKKKISCELQMIWTFLCVVLILYNWIMEINTHYFNQQLLTVHCVQILSKFCNSSSFTTAELASLLKPPGLILIKPITHPIRVSGMMPFDLFFLTRNVVTEVPNTAGLDGKSIPIFLWLVEIKGKLFEACWLWQECKTKQRQSLPVMRIT